MRNSLKPFTVFAGLLTLWQLLTLSIDIPSYILPGPDRVVVSLINNADLLWENTLITLSEMLMGLVLGVIAGIILAITLVYFTGLRPWLLPVLLITQAIPTFAMAPILMLWFGYGLTSKVVMTMLMIFFPVATCCYDGLRHTHQDWLDMASTMGSSKLTAMRYIRWPSALPALASGLRVAVVVAPIGAVIGEWVGSSEGLGYVMLQANARLLTDQMFAALSVLAFCSVGLYAITDRLLRWLIPWQQETSHSH
ncbi:ABC transporter permease [Candidatus Sororendozoicomonas aggregata]|uniref:ABC transporter permease n=1 Tax=Candidatus Sororendozoicomonas aggregata TaxID=3073239 RepID=UPI002ED25359